MCKMEALVLPHVLHPLHSAHIAFYNEAKKRVKKTTEEGLGEPRHTLSHFQVWNGLSCTVGPFTKHSSRGSLATSTTRMPITPTPNNPSVQRTWQNSPEGAVCYWWRPPAIKPAVGMKVARDASGEAQTASSELSRLFYPAGASLRCSGLVIWQHVCRLEASADF